MPIDPTLLPETVRTLAEAFDPSTSLTEALTSSPSLEDIHAYLTERIADLLARNPGMLMSILYRIDVPEARVTQVLTQGDPALIPAALADLVIERQLQKIETRRKHRDY